MGGEWWSFVMKGGCVWVTYTLNTRICIRVARGQDGVEVKSMKDLVLVKKDMLRFVQNMRAVRGMGWDISDHYVVLCKVRLVGKRIKRREVVGGARRIITEKLREHQHREEYARSLEGKRVEWDEENNV